MEIDLNALEQAALAATLGLFDGDQGVPYFCKKEFCDAASPEAVLELIRRLRVAESDADQVSEIRDQLSASNSSEQVAHESFAAMLVQRDRLLSVVKTAIAACDAELSTGGRICVDLDAMKSAVASVEPCEYCGGSGDVHRADGEWLGECHCVKGGAA